MTLPKRIACFDGSQPRLLQAVRGLLVAITLIVVFALDPSRDASASSDVSSDATEIQLLGDSTLADSCESSAGGSAASHCCSGVGCIAAIIAPKTVPLAAPPKSADLWEPELIALTRSPVPLFHPPKQLI